MSVPENPTFGPITFDSPESVPTLTEFVRSINANRTRIGKVYDFLLDSCCDSLVSGKCDPPDQEILLLLSATSAFPDLPNRKRLIEIVEAAMPKEDGK